MKRYLLIGLLGFAGCGEDNKTSVAVSGSSLIFSYESVFGWGSLGAHSFKSSTGGPGPVDKNAQIVCFTEQLPPGIEYTCESPAPGAIQMNLFNTTNDTIYVGNKWAGAIF